jgi:hypothetical protein
MGIGTVSHGSSIEAMIQARHRDEKKMPYLASYIQFEPQT